MQKEIKSMIQESVGAKKLVYDTLTLRIEDAVKLVANAFKSKKKVLIAGNGGSASQASHIAAEFVGRYKIKRKGLPCIALTADTSILTAWSNDYSYDTVFERQIEALGNEGDVLIVLSTSGNSSNIIRAVQKAKKMKINVIGFLGKKGGKMKNVSDVEIIIPSGNTPRIQEAHIMIMHIICEVADNELFGE